jgi:hypothetical protein
MACDSLEDVIKVLERFTRRLPQRKKRGTWGYNSQKLLDALRVDSVAFSIFVKGNGKLPFYAFSALPKYTCPAAGDCLNWCYSFRAWRYPAAFFRQLQNTILLTYRPDTIANAFLALPNGIEFRLYVDGDFESSSRVAYWMGLLEQRVDVNAYGYSKSWAELLEHEFNVGVWPTNYTLNLSSGSKWANNAAYFEAVSRLPITRGQFVAVPIASDGIPNGSKRYDSAEYHSRVRNALREQYGKRVVSCGGLCGDCGNGKHWCGDRNKLENVVIGIGIH